MRFRRRLKGPLPDVKDRVERWRVLYPEERALLRKAVSVATNSGSGFGWPQDEMKRLDTMAEQLWQVEDGPRKRF